MIKNNSGNKASLFLPQLDIFRGIAVIFMVYNHASIAFIPKREGLAWFLGFTSSFAPVLFFFATGVGYGLRYGKKVKKSFYKNIIYKSSLLIIADQFRYWHQQKIILGVNFLGFIGIILLVLAMVKASKRPIKVCLLIIGLSFTLRYIIGPVINDYISAPNLLLWVTGTNQNKMFVTSYPFSPWIIYPCLGYLLGVMTIKKESTINYLNSHRKNFILCFSFISLLLFSSVSIMMIKKVRFLRWGTVNFSFFWMSFAVLLIIFILLFILTHLHWINIAYKYLGIRGIASLAIVPIHYFLIYAISILIANEFDFNVFLVVVSILISAVFFLSKETEGKTIYFSKKYSPRTCLGIGLASVIVSGFALFYFSSSEVLSELFVLSGQLSICLLFSLRW